MVAPSSQENRRRIPWGFIRNVTVLAVAEIGLSTVFFGLQPKLLFDHGVRELLIVLGGALTTAEVGLWHVRAKGKWKKEKLGALEIIRALRGNNTSLSAMNLALKEIAEYAEYGVKEEMIPLIQVVGQAAVTTRTSATSSVISASRAASHADDTLRAVVNARESLAQKRLRIRNIIENNS